MGTPRSRIFTMATFGSMAAVFAGMINLVTIRDIPIMITIAGVLAALTVLAVRERGRIRREQAGRSPPK